MSDSNRISGEMTAEETSKLHDLLDKYKSCVDDGRTKEAVDILGEMGQLKLAIDARVERETLKAHGQPPQGSSQGMYWVLWLVPAVALFAALAPWPYAYYQFLRLLVCAASAFVAFIAWSEKERVTFWTVAFAVVAILFNPVAPIYLGREVWGVIDVATGGMFVAHLIVYRASVRKLTKE